MYRELSLHVVGVWSPSVELDVLQIYSKPASHKPVFPVVQLTLSLVVHWQCWA